MNKGIPLFPPEGSDIAPRVDALALYMVGVTIFFTILIFGLITFFAVKYRARPGRIAEAVHTHLALELAWSVIPLFLVLVMFVWGLQVFVAGSRPPAGALRVYVIGKQWMWHIQHPEGRKEINELHVPLGVPIKLIMTSQDVIHDFGLPGFRIKRDVVPNMVTEEWFTGTTVGPYKLFCDQYCGAEHAQMAGTVQVMEPKDYEAWLAGVDAGKAMSVAGNAVFVANNCNACHGEWAPTLAGLYMSKVPLADGRTVIADEDYLRRSVLDPAADIVAGYETTGTDLMPTFRGSLTEEQLDDLIEYIKSLGPAMAAGQPTTRPGGTQAFTGGATIELRKPGVGGTPPVTPTPGGEQ